MKIKSSFVKRTISGVLFTAIVMIGTAGIVQLSILLTLLSLVMISEYHRMTVGTGFRSERLFICLTSLLAVLCCSLIFCGFVGQYALLFPVIPLFAAALIHLFSCTVNLRNGESRELDSTDASIAAHLVFPLLYVTFPLCTIFLLVKDPAGDYSYRILWALFIMIWSSDVFAYLFGILFGQRPRSLKLFPSISPKKSWAGVIGGTVMTVAVSVGAYFVAGREIMPVWHWVVIAVIIVICGVTGDLFESLVKRFANVKDSGNIMPGHGGMLDRFDDVLFIMPVVALYLKLFSII